MVTSARISYHAVYDTNISDALAYAHKNGFTGIQIAAETPHLSFECLSSADLLDIVSLLEKWGLYITVHAPDNTTSLFQCSRHIFEGVMRYFSALLEFARRIDAPLVTIHLGSITAFAADDNTGRRIPDQDMKLYISALERNIETILALSAGKQTICIENYGIGQVEMDLLQQYLGRDGLFLCWDVAKGAIRRDIETRFLASPHLIRQVHLHDSISMPEGGSKSHRVIGSGILDFHGIVRTIHQLPELLDCCVEVRPREKARESLLALKGIEREVILSSRQDTASDRD